MLFINISSFLSINQMPQNRNTQIKRILRKMHQGQAQWLTPVILVLWEPGRAPVMPATREAETENCLNPGGGGCSELSSHYCTPA